MADSNFVPGARARINFTPEKLKALKRQYQAAIQAKQETFVFEGHEVLVTYARYMIEYLSRQFS